MVPTWNYTVASFGFQCRRDVRASAATLSYVENAKNPTDSGPYFTDPLIPPWNQPAP
jgi:hypothetical protein